MGDRSDLENIFMALCFGYWLLLTITQRLFTWWTKKSPKDVLLESIEDARLFEEWEAAAYQLDEVLGFDLW